MISIASGCVSDLKTRTPLAEHATLAGLLTENGYQTRAQGKMHFIPEGEKYGFEEMEPPSAWQRLCGEDPAIGTVTGARSRRTAV